MLGDGDSNFISRHNDVSNPIDDDDVDISPPSHEEVTIIRSKNNKSAGTDGMPDAFFVERW